MKLFIRFFFKTLRIILAPVMPVWEFFTRPKGIVRSPALQQKVDQQCRSMVLYQYRTCPFCIKVRQEMRRLSMPIDRRNVQKDGVNRADLVRGGGQAKVPCLKITDPAGHSEWLYDSAKIIAYLRATTAASAG